MLNINNVYKNFGDLKVLQCVSTEIKSGEVVSIIGASGSGKSTLLRCMNLLETPTFGEIWMEGKLLTPVDPYLHFDVIRASKTYKALIASGLNDEEAIQKKYRDCWRNALIKPVGSRPDGKSITGLYADSGYLLIFREKNAPESTVLELPEFAAVEVLHATAPVELSSDGKVVMPTPGSAALLRLS